MYQTYTHKSTANSLHYLLNYITSNQSSIYTKVQNTFCSGRDTISLVFAYIQRSGARCEMGGLQEGKIQFENSRFPEVRMICSIERSIMWILAINEFMGVPIGQDIVRVCKYHIVKCDGQTNMCSCRLAE